MCFEAISRDCLKSDKAFQKLLRKQQKELEMLKKKQQKERSLMQRQHCLVVEKIVTNQEKPPTDKSTKKKG